MDHTDLYLLRETYNKEHILLCFNGPFSQGLIVEIGAALKNHLECGTASRPAAFDVFAVYVEMAQNIRRYAVAKGYDDDASSSTVVVGRDLEGRYVITAGNIVESKDGEALINRIGALAELDKPGLKSAYKDQLRKPREDAGDEAGAGLGLIDMARKASAPLSGSLQPLSDSDRLFFSLRVVI